MRTFILCLFNSKNMNGKMGLSRQFILSCDDESCDFKEQFFSSQRCNVGSVEGMKIAI